MQIVESDEEDRLKKQKICAGGGGSVQEHTGATL